MRPEGHNAPGCTVKLKQSGRRLKAHLWEQGMGCSSHYANFLVSEFQTQRGIIKLYFKGEVCEMQHFRIWIVGGVRTCKVLSCLPHIWTDLVWAFTIFTRHSVLLMEAVLMPVAGYHRKSFNIAVTTYFTEFRILFAWQGSISPWNMYHNYKTFSEYSIATHWQHLTSFKIKTIFLYEFQLLAS